MPLAIEVLVALVALKSLGRLGPTHAQAEAYRTIAPSAPIAACGWRRGEILETTGIVETSGLEGRFIRRVETGSGRLFDENDLGIAVTRNGFDGNLAWSQDMSGGVHDLNSDFARRLAVSMAWLDARHGCSPARSDDMTPLTNPSRAGRRFVAWKAAPHGGVPFELWYDRKTRRLDRAFFQMTESRLIRHFADWRDIGGGRLAAFEQRDEFPEDEDEIVRRISTTRVSQASRRGDFARPKAPHDLFWLNNQRSASVPFEDDHRTRIYVPVQLNGMGPFLFELDSGGHNILTTETAEAIGLAPAGSFSSTGAGNEIAQSGIARVARIQIGDALLTDQLVKVRKFSASSNDRSPNPPRAGILGLELFERLAVAIDPQAKTVTLSAFGSAVTPRGAAIPLVFAEDAPLIAGTYRGAAGDFMLDTGNSGPTIIEDFWARARGLSTKLQKGFPRGDAKVSIDAIGLGPLSVQHELVSYYGPADRGSEYSRAVAGVYGEPLLSRFRSTYDYALGSVWLEPLPNLEPLPFDRSGLSLVKAERGVFKVSAVADASPAHLAAIRVGDVITAVGGEPAQKLSRADAAALLREDAGTRLLISGTFSGVEGTRAIILRDLVKP